MAQKEKVSGRTLALTIIVGIFIAIISVVLINLIVDYAYESPKYEDYCNFTQNYPAYADKVAVNCSYNEALNTKVNSCFAERGTPIYSYDNRGCSVDLVRCDTCSIDYDSAMKGYNRNVFFVFAVVGFILIVLGLFAKRLLLQIIALPAGAILVIESAIRNFNDKLAVIIVLALLVVAAIYLALKKLR
jgi:hypothetical protein